MGVGQEAAAGSRQEQECEEPSAHFQARGAVYQGVQVSGMGNSLLQLEFYV